MHFGGVLALLWEFERDDRLQKPVWNLNQDTGTINCIRI